MHVVVAIRMNQHDDLAIEKTEGHQPFLAVSFANIFAGDREVVSYGLCPFEIESVVPEIVTAFGLIPGGHKLIVVTI